MKGKIIIGLVLSMVMLMSFASALTLSFDKEAAIDLEEYYNKSEVYNKSETYNQSEIDLLISAGGYTQGLIAPVYFTLYDSNVTGYYNLSYNLPPTEESVNITISDGEELLYAQFIYEEEIDSNLIPEGQYYFHYYRLIDGENDGNSNTVLRAEVFMQEANGTQTELFNFTSDDINDETYTLDEIYTQQPAFNVNPDSRLGVRVYALRTATNPNDVVISSLAGDGRAGYFTTPLAYRHTLLRGLNEDPNFLHINSTEKSNYDESYSWGDHADAGYITDGNTNWNNEYGFVTDANLTETDPIWNSDKSDYYTLTQVNNLAVSTFTNDAGYITDGNTNWNNVYGFVTNANLTYSETDPVFVASDVYDITNTDQSNWDTAYSWGNHALVGYLTSYTETDPIWTAASGNYYTSTQVNALPISTFTNDVGYITDGNTNWNNVYGFVTNANLTYTESDPIANARIDNLVNFSGDYNDLTNQPTIPSLAGYFNNITNFTGTLTTDKYCTWTGTEIQCNSEGGTGGTGNVTLPRFTDFMDYENYTYSVADELFAANLVNYWKFEDNQSATTAEDSVGTLDGTLTGTGLWSTSGKISNAVDKSSSTGDRIDFSAYSLSENDFTITGWVYYNSLASDSQLIVIDDGSTANRFRIKQRTATGGMGVEVNTPSGGSTRIGYTSVSTGQWYHFAVTRDTTEMCFYLDNSQKGCTSQSEALADWGDNIEMLSWAAGGTDDGTFILDEVGFYNTSLNATQRNYIYNTGSGRTYTESENATGTAVFVNSTLYVNNTVIAEDYITRSKVADAKSIEKSVDKLDNIEEWLNDDGEIQYDKHYAKVELTDEVKLVPIYEEVLVPDLINSSLFSKQKQTYHTVNQIVGYEEESVKKYGLSMETRVAEMEKMIWELNNRLETLEGVKK